VIIASRTMIVNLCKVEEDQLNCSGPLHTEPNFLASSMLHVSTSQLRPAGLHATLSQRESDVARRLTAMSLHCWNYGTTMQEQLLLEDVVAFDELTKEKKKP
jgi:hypothetical protein